ncbi:MAG: hypothetical protein WC420_03920 [Candidatus Paceibacterota bacterium]
MTMSEWNYGDAYKRHPIGYDETAIFDDGSMIRVHNIYDALPSIMENADMIFVDSPWNLGNLNSFYTKAGRTDYQDSFDKFYKRLFGCVREIAPHTCYVEVGKEYLGEFLLEMKNLYRYVTFYNSTYYHKKDSLCYVVRGSKKRKKLPLDGMDEENIIKWVCANEEYKCIGDLCIGRGLVGLHAYKNNHRFVGTDLNKKRLSVLLEKVSNEGGTYQIVKNGADENAKV